MRYGRYAIAASSAPRRCSVLDERHGLAVERGVLGRRRRAEVRLQRDVAEILAARGSRARSEWPRMRGHRQRHLPQQLGDVDERQRRELDRAGVQREHERRPVGRETSGSTGGRTRRRSAARRAAGRRARPVSRRNWSMRAPGAGVGSVVGHGQSTSGAVARRPSRVEQDLRDGDGGRRRTRTRSVTMHSSSRQPAPTSTSSHRIDRVTRAEGSIRQRRPMRFPRPGRRAPPTSPSSRRPCRCPRTRRRSRTPRTAPGRLAMSAS